MENKKEFKVKEEWAGTKIEHIEPLKTESDTKTIVLSKEDINVIINILNVCGNGKYVGIIQKLRA
jgi:hypothetical protein